MRPLWKKIRHRIEVLGMRALVASIPKMRRATVLSLANFAGDLVFAFDGKGREVALANLAAAFGDQYLPGERNRITRLSYRNLARTFLDLFWAGNLTSSNFRELIDVKGEDAFFAATDPGQGCLVFAAHLGNFEWIPLTMGLLGRPPMAIGQDIKNPEITPIFQEARSIFGSDLIPQERAALRMLKALKRGKTCGFLVDLTLKLDQPGHLINAFGMKKWVTGVHVTLSSLAKARLIPLILLPLENGRYEFSFLPEISLSPALSDYQLTQLCWDQIEKSIRLRPECWLWNYKHWRYCPEGATNYPFYANSSGKFQALCNQENVTGS